MMDANYRFSIGNQIKRLKSDAYDAVYLTYHYLESKTKVQKFLYKKRLIRKYNIFIFKDVTIGRNLNFPHPTGIVIGKGAVIGNDVTIYQQVTIGGKNIGDTKTGRIPEIEDGVVLFAGAKILGDVKIAKQTRVGANAVVLNDTEAGSVYAGIPAKRIK